MKSVAIVGASSRRHKFGNKSVRAHLAAGWKVYPVNPREATIESLEAYATVVDITDDIDRLTLYVAPHIGMEMLDDIAKARPGEVFLNPGADSDELIAALRDRGLNVTTGCSIVDVGYSPSDFPDH